MRAMGIRTAFRALFERKSLTSPDAALLELYGAVTTAART
jgi:hypothetical protein